MGSLFGGLLLLFAFLINRLVASARLRAEAVHQPAEARRHQVFGVEEPRLVREILGKGSMGAAHHRCRARALRRIVHFYRRRGKLTSCEKCYVSWAAMPFFTLPLALLQNKTTL